MESEWTKPVRCDIIKKVQKTFPSLFLSLSLSLALSFSLSLLNRPPLPSRLRIPHHFPSVTVCLYIERVQTYGRRFERRPPHASIFICYPFLSASLSLYLPLSLFPITASPSLCLHPLPVNTHGGRASNPLHISSPASLLPPLYRRVQGKEWHG